MVVQPLNPIASGNARQSAIRPKRLRRLTPHQIRPASEAPPSHRAVPGISNFPEVAAVDSIVIASVAALVPVTLNAGVKLQVGR